jgi:hypothetical protein
VASKVHPKPLRRMTTLRGSLFAACLAGVLATTAAPHEARALDADQALTSASQQITSVSQGLGAIQAAIQRSRGVEKNASQRVADAVLFLGAKDYSRAIDLLNLIIEKYPDHPTAFPDAVALLGEAPSRASAAPRRTTA